MRKSGTKFDLLAFVPIVVGTLTAVFLLFSGKMGIVEWTATGIAVAVIIGTVTAECMQYKQYTPDKKLIKIIWKLEWGYFRRRLKKSSVHIAFVTQKRI